MADTNKEPLSRVAPLPEPDNSDEGCNACDDTGLLDPYGAFGLGDGPCPECEPAKAEPPAWERKPVTHEWRYVDQPFPATTIFVVPALHMGWTVAPWVRGLGCPASRPIQPSEREESNR